MKYILLLTSFLFFLGLSNISGQRFEVVDEEIIASEDGLVRRQVTQLDRDDDGQYWFLSGGRLQEFDGDRFTATFGNNLGGRIAKFILLDKEVFVISNGGIFQLEKEQHRFASHSSVSQNIRDVVKIENELFALSSENFNEKPDEDEFVALKENLHRIHHYDKEADSFKIIHEFYHLQCHKRLSKNGDNWILLADSSIIISNNNQQSPIEINYEKSKINYPSLLHTSGNNKSYFSFRNGFGYYELSTDGSVRHINSDKQLVNISEDLKSNLILLFGNTSDRRIREMQILTASDSIIKLPGILRLNEFLLDVYSEDVYNELLCSSHLGIYYYKFNNSAILRLGHIQDKVKSEFGAMTRYVYGTKDSSIFYLNESGGLFKTDFVENSMINGFDNYGRKKGFTRLYYDKETDLSWVLEFRNREGSILAFDHKSNSYESYPCRGRTEDVKRYDEDHLVIVGYFTKEKNSDAQYGYVSLFNMKTKKQTHMEFGRDTVFRSVYVNDDLWLGTQGKGLLKLTTFYDREGIETIEATRGANIKNIDFIDGSMYLSTYGKGLLHLDDEGKLIKEANLNSSLNSNEVTGVVKDFRGNYWVSTFNGIDLLNDDFQNITHLSPKDGLPSHEFNGGAYCSFDNKIYFGSINGICQIDPKVYYNSYTPEGYFISNLRSIKNDNELLFSKSENTYSIQGIPDQIRFNIREFGFTQTKDFNILKKLEVFTKPNIGHVARDNGELVINNPKQGSFTLIARNRKSTADEFELASLNLQRNWDQILQNIFIAILTLAISIFVARQIIKRNNKIAQERTQLNQRIAETKLEALRSQMNPHFIFNSLGAIQYYIQNNEKNIAAKYLSKFAKLMRQFLEASKHERVSLHDEIETLSLYLELEKLRFEDKFEYEIEVDEDIDLYDFEIPSMLIQPFIENALLHGVNHLESRQGLIQMSIDKVKGGILCVVDDNGVGRAKTQEIHKRSVKKHKSRATQIINERLAVLKKDEDLEIDIKYMDKLDEEGKGLGTMVKIFIPS